MFGRVQNTSLKILVESHDFDKTRGTNFDKGQKFRMVFTIDFFDFLEDTLLHLWGY